MYIGDLGKSYMLGLCDTTPWIDLIAQASITYGVDECLIRAFIMTESSCNPNAYKSEPQINDGSCGLMQVLLKTGRWMLNNPQLTQQQLFDPATNINAGVKYIAYQLKRYGGDVKKAVAAYNAGSARYTLGGDFVNQVYVDRVFGRYQECLGSVIVLMTDTRGNQITENGGLAITNLDQVDSATVDVPDMPSEVADAQKTVAAVDDPTAVQLPINPIMGGLVAAGIAALVGGGFTAWKVFK